MADSKPLSLLLEESTARKQRFLDDLKIILRTIPVVGVKRAYQCTRRMTLRTQVILTTIANEVANCEGNAFVIPSREETRYPEELMPIPVPKRMFQDDCHPDCIGNRTKDIVACYGKNWYNIYPVWNSFMKPEEMAVALDFKYNEKEETMYCKNCKFFYCHKFYSEKFGGLGGLLLGPEEIAEFVTAIWLIHECTHPKIVLPFIAIPYRKIPEIKASCGYQQTIPEREFSYNKVKEMIERSQQKPEKCLVVYNSLDDEVTDDEVPVAITKYIKIEPKRTLNGQEFYSEFAAYYNGSC